MPRTQLDAFRSQISTIAKRVNEDVSGSTAIIFSLALPVLLIGAGAATMYAYQLNTRTALQAAVDAGALAGTALTAEATDKQRIDAAMAAFRRNFGGTGSMASGNSGYIVASSGAVPKFSVTNWEVSGEAVATISNPFAGIIGDSKLHVKVGAVGAKMESEPICVLGLNADHADTIDMSGQPKLIARGCAVQANSSSGSGLNQKGRPILRAKTIGTSGGFTGAGYEPPPIVGTIPVADPYASIPFPDSAGCDYNDVKISGETRTLDEGVYCGGIRIVAGGKAILNPGIYIMKDGPLWINGGGEISGQEVMIGFTGPDATLYMDGSSALDLTSPVSGTYANMQFMQEPGTGGDDLYFSAVGNNTMNFDGALYMPTQEVWFGGGTIATISSPTYALVADKIWVQDQSEIMITLENKRNIDETKLGRVRYGARLIR